MADLEQSGVGDRMLNSRVPVLGIGRAQVLVELRYRSWRQGLREIRQHVSRGYRHRSRAAQWHETGDQLLVVDPQIPRAVENAVERHAIAGARHGPASPEHVP